MGGGGGGGGETVRAREIGGGWGGRLTNQQSDSGQKGQSENDSE